MVTLTSPTVFTVFLSVPTREPHPTPPPCPAVTGSFSISGFAFSSCQINGTIWNVAFSQRSVCSSLCSCVPAVHPPLLSSMSIPEKSGAVVQPPAGGHLLVPVVGLRTAGPSHRFAFSSVAGSPSAILRPDGRVAVSQRSSRVCRPGDTGCGAPSRVLVCLLRVFGEVSAQIFHTALS